MKKLFIICILILAAAFFISCEKDTIDPTDNSIINNPKIENVAIDKLELMKQIYDTKKANRDKSQVSAQGVAITYLADLCNGPVSATHGTANTYYYPELWDYYYFSGEAGNIISIYVPRTSPDMDPAMSLYFGIATTSEGLTVTNGGTEMSFLAFADDEADPNFISCFGDPKIINYELPSTGTYTLAVFDNLSCGTNLTYDVYISGTVCGGDFDADFDGIYDSADNCINTPNADQLDTDGDVIGDVCDNCPDTSNADQADSDGDGIGNVCDNCLDTSNTDQANYDNDSHGNVCDTDDDNDGCADTEDPIVFSNIEAIVNIDGCNTGATNKVTSTCGYTMSDRIDALEGGTYTKKETFIKAVTKLTTEWQRGGLITMAEKNLILKCARKASY